MERPRAIEHVTEFCAETRRKIGAFVVAELEKFDAALDVDYGTDDELDIPDNIVRGTE